MMRSVYVDNRYRGNHGIARYAREVVTRLHLPWTPLPGKYRPGSPVDAIDVHRMRLSSTAILYNPGYTAGLTRATQLVTLHDLIHLRAAGKRGWINRLYYDRVVRPAICSAGHVLTVSETTARELRAWLGNGVQVHNAGNGCSDVFDADHGSEVLDQPYFLFVGTFKKHKNPEPLFGAMRRFPDHQLVVVSGDRVSAKELAQNYGIEDRVQLRTNVDDVELSRLYRGAEAFVFPSTWEGFGLPVLEALKSGTKVVYSAAAESVAEICGNTQHAVEDARCSDEIADAMTMAINTEFEPPPSLADYTWENVTAKVEAVINVVDEALTTGRNK